MNISFDTERWHKDLIHLSMRHKVLILLLESLADPAGVVTWSEDHIESLAGEKFRESDLDALKHRVVPLDRTRLLLPDYMRTQFVTLSPTAPPHKKVWKALELHWGAKGDDVEYPFVVAWREMGIEDRLPSFGEVRMAGQIPPWYAALLKRARLVIGSVSLAGFPPLIRDALKDFFDYRLEKAIQTTSKAHGDKWDWSISHAERLLKSVKAWLKDHTEKAVSDCIRNAMGNNHPSPLEPKAGKFFK